MKINDLLQERYLNLLDRSQKEPFYNEIERQLELSYKAVPGGLGRLNKDDLLNQGLWKLVKRNDSIVAGSLYRESNGRKIRLVFSDGSSVGKHELLRLLRADVYMGRSWVEASEPLETCLIKLGAQQIPAEHAQKLLNVKFDKIHADGVHYDRIIDGKISTKIVLGSINQR